MKKLILIALSLFIFSGCVSEGKTNISNEKEVIYTLENYKLTKGDTYDLMLSQVGYMAILNEAQNYIMNQKVTLSDEDNKKIDEELKNIKDMYPTGWEEALTQSGFANEQAFKDTITLNKKNEIMINDYISGRFDELVTLYSPKQIQVMSYTDLETANSALAEVKDNVDFEEVAKTYKFTGNAAKYVYTNQAALPFDVKTFIDKGTNNQLSDVITETITNQETEEESQKYYIVKVVETNSANFKDDIIKSLSSMEHINTEMLVDYFNEYDFKVYNQDIKDFIDNINPDFLG